MKLGVELKSIAGIAAIIAGLTGFTSSGMADVVNSTLSATYYSVVPGSPDFPGANAVVQNGSGLVNGLPVATGAASLGPNGELLWWSTANPAVTVTGTGIVTLPYNSNMYAPNSTGTDDANAFETARFSGNFTLAASGTVNFQVGSDDDTFVYLNGVLIGQNPGIHGVTVVNFAGSALSGLNTLDIFYADRQHTGAFLSVNADVQLTATTPAVPEASTWAMMILGFAGLGFMAYRRNQGALNAA